MMLLRIFVLALVLSVITWLFLRVKGKRIHFGIVLAGWILAGFGLILAFYGVSILIANSNNF